MFCNTGIDYVIKVAVAVLLSQSLLVYAKDQAINASEPVVNAAPESSIKARQQVRGLPRWPEHRRSRMMAEMPPPPPSGPYMSSALSGSSIEGLSFDDDKSAMKFEPPAQRMEAFGPDTPWPGNSNSLNRWVPEKGYNYVQPVVKKQPYPGVRYDFPVNYTDGYNRGPGMNMPGMRGSYVQRPNTAPPGYSRGYNAPAQR